MKSIMANHYCKIIKKIGYDTCDIIGVSYGGGVASFISKSKEISIRHLILMAPGIFTGIKVLPKEQKITLGWCIQDVKVPYLSIGKQLISELENFNNSKVVLTSLDQSILDELKKIENKQEYDKQFDDYTHRLQDNIFDIL